MTQKPDKLIDLAVHESAYPSASSPNSAQEAAGDVNDLNDSVHDQENADVPIPELIDPASDQNQGDRQVTIANLSAG